jgi:hypothetical protein
MKRVTVLLMLACAACRQRPVTAAEAKHLVAVHKTKEVLYLDRLDNRVVMQRADTAGTTTFCSFLVGMRDSLPLTDAQRKLDRERYIQYSMQQDWTAIVGGDSLKPVFFQEKPSLDGQLKEGALVFELPRGQRADTLVYRDTYGNWGTQVFVLNEK